MSCQSKEQRIKHLVDSGMIEKEAAKIVDSISKMNITNKMDFVRHPFVNLINMANEVGITYLMQPLTLTKMRQIGERFTIEGKTESGKLITVQLSPNLGELKLDNGTILNADTVAGMVKDLEFIHNTNGYETLVTDMMNDPGKVIELAEDLAKDADVPMAEDYKNALINNLQNIVEPLRKLQSSVNVHLNKRQMQEHGKIDISPSSVDVYISDNVENRTKSKLETYVHELYHAVTGFALSNNDPKLQGFKRQISEIRKEFLKNITADKLAALSNKYVDDTPITKEQAEAILDYISNKETGLEEFVAYAMSNKPVARALFTIKTNIKEEHPDLISKLAAMVRKIIEAVTRRIDNAPKTNNDYDKMVWLVSKLAHVHSNHVEKKRGVVVENLLNAFAHTEEQIQKKIQKFVKSQEGKVIAKPSKDTSWHNAWYLARLSYGSVFSETNKRQLEFAISGFGKWFKPEGSLLSIIRDMSQSDFMQDLAEMFGLGNQQIDQAKRFRNIQVRKAVNEGFSRELSEEELVNLTDVLLDTDINVFSDEADMISLLKQDVLNAKIKEIEDSLDSMGSTKEVNYYKAQAKGLAGYMIDGSGNLAQLMNARNIAMRLNTKNKVDEVNEDLVTAIDKLATLYAIKKIPQVKRNKVIELANEELTGIANLVAYHKGIKERSEKELFTNPSDKLLMIKGHTSEIYADDREIVVAPLADKEKMRKQGYKFIKELKRHPKDSNPVVMAQYATNTQVKRSFQSIGLRMTDRHRIGTTLSESYAASGQVNAKALAKEDIKQMKILQANIVKEMEEGTYDPDKETVNTLIPLLDTRGRTSEFRYVMLKKDKIEKLGMDRRANHVMGKTYATSYDKSASVIFNDEFMKAIKEDARINYREGRKLGHNLKEYITVSKDSHDAEVRDYWSILPDNIKIANPDGIVVRRDLMRSYFGFREMGISEFSLFKRMPEAAKYAMTIAEKLWKEVIRITKADIIIRTPSVIMGNIWSNFLIPLMMGENPIEVMKLTLQGVRELTEYVKSVKHIVTIEAKVDSGIATQQEKRLLNVLKEDINKSAVKDLVDAGFYTSIVEELENEVDDKGIMARFLNDKLKSTPTIVRNGLNLLYVTENSMPFKLIAAATQYSDFSARYAQYHLSIRRGMNKDLALKKARDYYVNYHKPNGRFVEYANQLGFVMFTKYFTRIQKAIRDYGVTHPLKLLLFITGQYAFIDVGDITDQSLIEKNLSVLFYNPFEAPLNIAMPTGYEWARDTLKML